MTKQDEDLLQYLIDRLNEGYEEYKRDHPDFRRVVEKQEGKPEDSYGREDDDHCSNCGEWLQGFDACSQCGRINKV